MTGAYNELKKAITNQLTKTSQKQLKVSLQIDHRKWQDKALQAIFNLFQSIW